MSNLRAREDFRRAFNVQARIIGFPLVALGLLSTVSGALGLDVWNRFFTGGALGLNDLVPGVVLLSIGLVLLRVSGGAPLTEQVRSIRHWDAYRWISFSVTAVGVLVGTAVAVSGRCCHSGCTTGWAAQSRL